MRSKMFLLSFLISQFMFYSLIRLCFSDTSPEDVWGDPPPVVECRRVRPLLEKFFERWPTAKAAKDASAAEIQTLIEPLEMGEHVAQLIIRFSGETCNCSGDGY